MLVSDVIQDIRNRISDKEGIGDFDNDDIISYINQAINYVGLYFVTAQNPLALKEVEIINNDTVPDDYIKMCGIIPVRVIGKTIKFLDSSTKRLTMKYFYKPPNIGAGEDETMPYDDNVTNNLIVSMSVLMLMNQQRLNVSQDQTLNDALMNMINSAYGASA